MSNKQLTAIETALNNLNTTAKKIIISPNNEKIYSDNYNVVALTNNFDSKNALALIGNMKSIGIINSEKFNTQSITELIKTLTTENKATVVMISSSPVSCKIFYPTPEIGTKYIFGNYEYSYEQSYLDGSWKTSLQHGWGVRVVDDTQTDYASPLTVIQGHPVTEISGMFYDNHATTLNLIDWDTSNITNMEGLFSSSHATKINGLSNFNTSAVTSMNGIFYNSRAISLDLGTFDTSKVTNMGCMFSFSRVQSLDLSAFDTSNTTNMSQMFYNSKATYLDLSGFYISETTCTTQMFRNSQVETLIAKSQANTCYNIDIEVLSKGAIMHV